MMPMLRRTSSTLFLISFLISPFAATKAAGQVVPIDLGAPDSTPAIPSAVNDRGEVVGYLVLPGTAGTHAFVAAPWSRMLDLTPDRRSAAFDINNAGQIVGSVSVSASADHAALWSTTGGMVDLGTLGGPSSVAFKVNDEGQVFGSSRISATNATHHAFRWTAAAGMVDLGPLPGDFPIAANESGDAIFSLLLAGGSTLRAFLWTPTNGLRDLGTLGGGGSLPQAINDREDVVGSSDIGPEAFQHAFLWTSAAGIIDLGTLGGSSSGASAVNQGRWVVGASQTTVSNPNLSDAFLWTPTGGMVDLGTLGGPTSLASAVNDRGAVVGTSALPGQEVIHAFVWTATTKMVGLPPLRGYLHSEARVISDMGHIVGRSFDFAGADRLTMWVLPGQAAALDVTPPTLTVPDTIVVNATSAAGADVAYFVSVGDDTDPIPSVICTAASGSVFPLLTTTVSCTATDAAGNSTTDTFEVIVNDGPRQLADVISLMDSFNLQRSGANLSDKLERALKFAAADQPAQACTMVTTFLNQVRVQSGKSLTADQAAELTTHVFRIRTVMGC